MDGVLERATASRDGAELLVEAARQEGERESDGKESPSELKQVLHVAELERQLAAERARAEALEETMASVARATASSSMSSAAPPSDDRNWLVQSVEGLARSAERHIAVAGFREGDQTLFLPKRGATANVFMAFSARGGRDSLATASTRRPPPPGAVRGHSSRSARAEGRIEWFRRSSHGCGLCRGRRRGRRAAGGRGGGRRRGGGGRAQVRPV